MKTPLTTLFATMFVFGCGDPMISEVTPDGSLTPVSTARHGWASPDDEFTVRLAILSQASSDRLFQRRGGVIAFRVRSTEASVTKIITSAGSATSTEQWRSSDALYIPVKKGDWLEGEVVATLVPSNSTADLTKVSAILFDVLGLATKYDLGKFSDLTERALKLTGVNVERTITYAFRLRAGETCGLEAACTGALFNGQQLALTFGLDPKERADVHVDHGELKTKKGALSTVPMLLVGVQFTRFEDGQLPLACRRAWAEAGVRDGKQSDLSACALDSLLGQQAAALRHLKGLTDRARVKDASPEDFALAAEELTAWLTSTCPATFPAASAPCSFASKWSRLMAAAEPQLPQLATSLRAETAASKKLATVAAEAESCGGVLAGAVLFNAAEKEAALLDRCSEHTCVGLDKLNQLRAANRLFLERASAQCFLGRIDMARRAAATSEGARALLQSVTRRTLDGGDLVIGYDPSVPPTIAVLAEVALALAEAQSGLPETPAIVACTRELKRELERVAALHQVMSEGLDSLRTLIAYSLKARIASLEGSDDPWVAAKIRQANELLRQVEAQTLFVAGRGAPTLAPGAKDLFRRLLETEADLAKAQVVRVEQLK